MLRLKDLRESAGLTQRDLSEKIGTSHRNIGRWENGENDISSFFLIKLADFFGCSIDYLVGREDEYGNVNVQNDRSLSSDEEYLLVTFRKISKQRRLNLLEVATGLSKLDDHGV